jgi:hypothetical protein
MASIDASGNRRICSTQSPSISFHSAKSGITPSDSRAPPVYYDLAL